MPEYIDREALLAYKYDTNWNAPISYLPPEYVVTVRDILDAPVADVEPVVRCGNCKHLYFKDMSAFCQFMAVPCRPNGFCSNGERK